MTNNKTRRGSDDGEWKGHISAKVEEHDEDILEINRCLNIKREKISELHEKDMELHIKIDNLTKEVKSNNIETSTQTKILQTSLGKIEKTLNKIMWVIIGGSSVVSFMFFIMEKYPEFIKALL